MTTPQHNHDPAIALVDAALQMLQCDMSQKIESKSDEDLEALMVYFSKSIDRALWSVNVLPLRSSALMDRKGLPHGKRVGSIFQRVRGQLLEVFQGQDILVSTAKLGKFLVSYSQWMEHGENPEKIVDEELPVFSVDELDEFLTTLYKNPVAYEDVRKIFFEVFPLFPKFRKGITMVDLACITNLSSKTLEPHVKAHQNLKPRHMSDKIKRRFMRLAIWEIKRRLMTPGQQYPIPISPIPA